MAEITAENRSERKPGFRVGQGPVKRGAADVGDGKNLVIGVCLPGDSVEVELLGVHPNHRRRRDNLQRHHQVLRRV